MKSFAVIFAIVAMWCVIDALPTENQMQIPAESVARLQRQADGGHHHHDAVDFGAHTGDHGAFGWYADFPVHHGGH